MLKKYHILTDIKITQLSYFTNLKTPVYAVTSETNIIVATIPLLVKLQVQNHIIYLTPPMGHTLGGFQHRVALQLTGKQPCRLQEGS